jgi:decaprenylphospho-beta-D-ribofuranose 2-oxidase
MHQHKIYDFGRLDKPDVADIVRVRRITDIKKALKKAQERQQHITLVGTGKSQGGHLVHPKAIALDMKGFNRILRTDKQAHTIRVQSGCTWDQIQRHLNPLGLGLVTMQSSNDFTVGGSVSSNIHGRDIRHSSMVTSIRELTIMLADGKIVTTNRRKNRELFYYVIGGQGLFGIILEAELQLTDDRLYIEETMRIPTSEIATFFRNVKKHQPSVELIMTRPSVAPKQFLRDGLITTWRRAESEHADVPVQQLGEEKNVARDRLIYNLSRRYAWGKSMRSYLEGAVGTPVGKTRLISRNNAMRPPITPLKMLINSSKKHSDHTQEFFVPLSKFDDFMEMARKILLNRHTNVMGVTIRFIGKQSDPFLNYTKESDCVATMFHVNHPLSEKGRAHATRTIRELIDAAIACEGCSYLTYALQPTKKQLHTMYPNIDRFFAAKKKYDPTELFTTNFYSRYGHDYEK